MDVIALLQRRQAPGNFDALRTTLLLGRPSVAACRLDDGCKVRIHAYLREVMESRCEVVGRDDVRASSYVLQMSTNDSIRLVDVCEGACKIEHQYFPVILVQFAESSLYGENCLPASCVLIVSTIKCCFDGRELTIVSVYSHYYVKIRQKHAVLQYM